MRGERCEVVVGRAIRLLRELAVFFSSPPRSAILSAGIMSAQKVKKRARLTAGSGSLPSPSGRAPYQRLSATLQG
jgi:hypothetical protein